MTGGKTAIQNPTMQTGDMGRTSVLLAGDIQCQKVEQGQTSIGANHADMDPDRLASFKRGESQGANMQPPKYDYTALKYTDF